MDTDVIMKANSHGVRLILNEEHSFDQILADVTEKLQRQKGFLRKNGEVRVSFEGKELLPQERDRLIYELNHLPDTCVRFVEETEACDLCAQIDIPPHRPKNRKRDAKKDVSPPKAYSSGGECAALPKKPVTETDAPIFFRGNVCSGQTLEVKRSIVILGDVARSAKVVSNGNIIVIGALRGTADAGCDKREHRFVLALTMEPVHIKIGGAGGFWNRRSRKQFHTKDAVMATCENGQLVFQTLSQTSQ